MLSRLVLIISLSSSFSYAKSTATAGFKNGYPTAKTAQATHDEQDLQKAITAYRFWFPTVSAEAIFQGSRDIGINDNEGFMVLAAQPHHVGFTLNSDTPYGGGPIDVSKGPMVVEMPPGAFIGLINDHHQRWLADMGLPSGDGAKGGKYIIVPPGYKDKIPDGYHAVYSGSNKVLVAIRSLPTDGIMKNALTNLTRVRIYPYSSERNPQVVKLIDVTDRKMDTTTLKIEDNLQYWKVLNKVIQEEPLVGEFLTMSGMLESLGITKGKEFNPDARMRKILDKAAQEGHKQLMVTAFAGTRPDRMAWPDRKWEWAGLVADNGNFLSASGIDLQARDRWFAQAIVASPAMFRRTEGAGSLYWLGLRDDKGEYLDGGKSYKLRVPYPVPANLFWSVTAYDAQTRSEVQTDQNKAALRSLFELRDIPAGTESVSLYFGPNPPVGKEKFWIKTQPGRGWFTYFRIYGPQKAVFDQTWRPFDIVRVQTPSPVKQQQIGSNGL